MRILNPKVADDLQVGKLLRIDLGCGQRPKAGYYGLDHLEMPGVDIVAELNEPLSALPDNSVSEVHSFHVLEHVTNLIPLLRELHRVVVPDGKLELVVPHFSNPYGFSDPTHVRFFGAYTFHYFSEVEDQPRRKVPAFYIKERFLVDNVSVTLVPTILMFKPVRRTWTKLLGRSFRLLDWYERAMCRHFPIDSMRYRLRVKK